MTDESQQQRLSVRAAAAALGVSEAAILKRIRRKTLPANKDQGGQWRVLLPADSVPDGTGQRTGHIPDGPDILPDGVPDKPDTVPDTDQQAPFPLPADIVARMAALEAENAVIREALAEVRTDRDAWKDQARQALQALTNQQTLSLPGAMRDMPALTDGNQGQPKKQRRFLFWRW